MVEADIAQLFAPPTPRPGPAPWTIEETRVEKGHGRLKVREIRVSACRQS